MKNRPFGGPKVLEFFELKNEKRKIGLKIEKFQIYILNFNKTTFKTLPL